MKSGWEPWRPGRNPDLAGLPYVVGHRGAMAHAPENTLASIRRAWELGARWVEFDVKLSRDGVSLLMHDDTLDRTTNGCGPVAGMDARDLRELDAGGRFHPEFTGEPIPLLHETLALLRELEIGANVEIKPSPGREVETGEAVAHELLDLWPLGAPPVLISSFSRLALAAARAIAPDFAYGLLVERVPRDWETALQDLGCTTIHPWYVTTRTAVIRLLVRQGVPVLVYTVNDPGRAAKLLGAGARGIITDVPDRLVPIADQHAGVAA
jgi:glycerophosphoryl diester phosphodiesterase